MARRDVFVLRALRAGLSKNRIHILSGIARTTIDDLLREYPTVDTAAILRAQARANTGMTAAEFDYSLFAGDGRAMQAMNAAAFYLANEGHPESPAGDDEQARAQRQAWAQRAEEFWEQVLPELQPMIDRAKAMRFTGWSNAAKARGQKIDYAS